MVLSRGRAASKVFARQSCKKLLFAKRSAIATGFSLRLGVGDDHGSLRHLHRVLAQTDTALAKRRRAIHLRAHVGQNPLHCQTRTRNGSRWRRYLKRTSGNDELIRRQCRRRTADFHANIELMICTEPPCGHIRVDATFKVFPDTITSPPTRRCLPSPMPKSLPLFLPPIR